MTARTASPCAALVALLAWSSCAKSHDVGAVAFTQTITDAVDVLFVVDSANLAGTEAAVIAKELSTFAALVGESSSSFHIAVVPAELAVGSDGGAQRCPGLGAAGAFRRALGCRQPLAEPGPFFISSEAGRANFSGSAADLLECMLAPPGVTSACGIQQPFAATMAALDPRTMPVGNEGFLRARAELMVIFVMGTDDCSAVSPTLRETLLMSLSTDNSDAPYDCAAVGIRCAGGPPPNLAPDTETELELCASSEDPRLVTVADTVRFLGTLKDDRNKMFIGVIAGPATPFLIGKANTTGQASYLRPTCIRSDVLAYPAVRLQDLAGAFPSSGVFTSLCSGNLLADIAAHRSARAAHARCLSAAPALVPAGADAASDADGLNVSARDAARSQPDCQVVQQLFTSNGTVSSPISNCASAPPPCWTAVPDAANCPSSGLAMTVTAGAAPSIADVLSVRCLP